MVFCNSKTHFYEKWELERHNPYFNRWFSAIRNIMIANWQLYGVTILILIDGFLQYSIDLDVLKANIKSQSLF